MLSRVILLAAACLFVTVNPIKLPGTFKRCKVSSESDGKPNECLKEAVEDAIRQLSIDGNSEIGVSDFDPLKIEQILIEKGEESPIAVRLEYKNNDLTGLGGTKIKSISGKLSKTKNFELVLKSHIEEIHLKGPYSVNGKVLILPIQGVGESHMILQKLNAIFVIKGDTQMKNGKEYLRITDTKLDMSDVGRLITNLSNLFNGDKALGDNMNKFLNENWKEIYQELRPSVEGAFSAIFGAYSKRILERIQFKNIFLTE